MLGYVFVTRLFDAYEADAFGSSSETYEDSSTSMLIYLIILVCILRVRFIFLLVMVILFLGLSRVLGFGWFQRECLKQFFCTPNDLKRGQHGEHPVCALPPHPLPDLFPDSGAMIFCSVLLLVLSYSLEVLARKDFIQATMVSLESQRSDELLKNLLPQKIIAKLKNNTRSTASHYEDVSIMFIHVSDFTALSGEIDDPTVLVTFLNKLFYVMDHEVSFFRGRIEVEEKEEV